MGEREGRIKEAEKGGNDIRREEVKLPLIADNMILHTESHKGITHKINKIARFQDTRPIYKNHLYFSIKQ